MSQPVWVLSVDLQTKTATFQTGMADAAKSARGAFNDIKSGAGEVGRETGVSMTEARHGVRLLAEEFDIKLPRALSSFVASLGPVAGVMEAAFPFLAIIALAGILKNHLKELKEEGEKLAENEEKFITVTSNVFGGLEQKMLEAGIKSDELSENHLAALHKQLQLIDRASLSELVHSLEEVAKAADAVFGPLQAKWYEWCSGSRGAQHALNEFKTEYEKLTAQGKDKEASDLLRGTRESAERVLALMKQAKDNQGWESAPDQASQFAKSKLYLEAYDELRKNGVGWADKEVQAQQTLVETLQAQTEVEARINTLKGIQKSNASRTTGKAMGAEEDKRAKQAAEAEKAELDAAEKLWEENRAKAIANLQQTEREKIENEERGSAARLAAIDAAIKEENSKGLQETAFYRQLANERIQIIGEMAQEEKKLKAEAAREEANNEEKMGMLTIAAEKQRMVLADSARRVTVEKRIAEETRIANEEFNIKQQALQKEIQGLDKSGKDYENKLKQLQDKEKQLVRQHENEITAIKQKAEAERNKEIQNAARREEQEIAQGLASVIMRHQSFAQMMGSIGDQVVSGMLQTAIMSAMTMDMGKEKEAAQAARQGSIAGTKFPFPTNIVMAPLLAATWFAGVMAFEGGTDSVPGIGRGDVVPAMLSPGEGIVPGGVMDGLRNMARNGGFDQGQQIHVHGVNFAPKVHALDATGVDAVLTKHQVTFQRHFESTLRKMNR